MNTSVKYEEEEKNLASKSAAFVQYLMRRGLLVDQKILNEDARRRRQEVAKKAYWDFLSRYFRSRNVLVQQEKQLQQDMDSFDRRIRSMMASISASAESKTTAGNKPMLPLAAPSMAVADPLMPFDEETGSIESGPEEGAFSKKIRIPELEDWNKLQYRDLADDDCLYNLGQVIYETTGCLMPRKLDRYLPALKVLDRYGITGKKALHPLYYCMTLLGEGKNQTRPYFSNIQFIPDEEIDEDGFEDTSTEALKAEIASLKSEVKRLKQQSYDSSREVRDEKERYVRPILQQKVACRVYRLP